MKNPQRKHIILTVVVVTLLFALATAGAYQLLKPATPKPSPTPGAGKDTNVQAGPDEDTSTDPAATPVADPSRPSSATLAKPIGPNNNLSTVSLSGQYTTMESTCRSVDGATCQIYAKKGSQRLTVSDPKSIDADSQNDGVILDWSAKSLTTGTWQITAVASKGGQTAESDPQLLEVRQ